MRTTRWLLSGLTTASWELRWHATVDLDRSEAQVYLCNCSSEQRSSCTDSLWWVTNVWSKGPTVNSVDTSEENGELEVGHVIDPWCVEFVATSVNTGRKDPDGRTTWELHHGRPIKNLKSPLRKTFLSTRKSTLRGQAR